MFNYYNLNTIPIILKRFNVNNIIICGLSDKSIVNQIIKYCDNNSRSYIAIDQNDNYNIDHINDYPLDMLKELNNYEAIFLNDDPNWYTIYNELNIIKQTNENFPIVFICNNIFPHKRRDSYNNPEIIPKDFLNEYSNVLNYNGLKIYDDYYHAVEENTSKNGVLTAIEDFLKENKSIKLMDIKLTNGITILYPQNNISKIRLSKLSNEIEDYIIENDDLSDKIFENQLLTNHISKFKLLNEKIDILEEFKEELGEKEKIITDYKNKVKHHEYEFNYKDSQIKRFGAQLSKHEKEINNLDDKLNDANYQINEKINQITLINQEISNRDIKINDQINQIKNAENKLKIKNEILNSLKQQNIEQLFELDNKKYCIICYKNEISNKHLEIEYLKKDSVIKKLLNPFAYLYLIFKSNPQELSLNFKLYKALKNSRCFDIGFYLNNNKDIIGSKWCKYFSPELHYVCNGFEESRKFNKKYFNRNSKKELLEYILNCNY